ncbi:lamin tail domain-containing protein [Sphingomonas piscis]|uniref:lamin tail domain-containing protein n=1 Tax=Sphingomonas piscis TaxID=2714943 RepID=UPI0019D0EFDD|nr:lamin tail domain-containing protein [Sphingomonas piscis]
MAATDLIISEYIEGSSNNKAIELYNGTGTAINLTGYRIQMFFNGSTAARLTINLSGTVAAATFTSLPNRQPTQPSLPKRI